MMSAHETFGAWSSSASALWRLRKTLRDRGEDPESNDAYVTAYVEHYDMFPTPPAYPGRDMFA